MMNLEELNYPIPDPAWDYATIYHRCHHARQELEKLLAYMSQFEEATGESALAEGEIPAGSLY